LIAALGVGLLATAAWAQETTPSPSPTATETPAATPVDSPSPTDPGEPTPTPTPTETETPPPQPSPTPTGEETPAQQAASDPAAAGLSIVGSSPTTGVEVGDRMAVVVEVANLSSEAKTLTLSVTLPEQLGYISSVPPGFIAGGGPPPLGEFVGIDLGTIESGETTEATLELEALDRAPTGGALILFEVAGDGDAATTDLVVDIAEGDGPTPALTLSAAPPSDILGEIGDQLDYGLTVANTGDEVLEDVIVVERVPPEVRVVAAPLVKGIDAVQVGRFLAREDIVWVIEELNADERVRLPWRGVVQKAGDLEALASATASARRTPRVRAQAKSYLASPDIPSAPVNPPFTPIARRIPIEVEVPASSSGSLLPFTGAGIWGWAVAGILIVLFGVAIYRFGLPTARGKRVPGLLALVCVVAVACFSSSDREPSATGSPEVQGRRIERGEGGEPTTVDPEDENGSNESDGDDAPVDENGQDGDAPPTTDVDDDDSPFTDGPSSDDPPNEADEDEGTETVTRFVVDEITLADLPVESAPTTTGSSGSFVWNESARRVTTAASSRSFVAGAPLSVITTVHDEGGTITANVTLVNESDDERISVDGSLSHSVSGPGGVLADLDSDAIDTLLSPGGRVTATFEYLLPSGAYNVSGSFLANA
jgi:uncharacterized repeat protein (TIGR01451 family)